MAGAAEGRALSLAVGARAWSARALAWRPPQIAVALVVMALAGHVALWGPNAPFGRLVWAGLALEAIGTAWMLWAWWCFRIAGTPIAPTARPLRFVDDGPFRVGRNPMYLGMTVALLGLALKLGAPTLLLAAAAFVAIMQRVHIPHEEAQLRAAFGGWYSDYAATVRRWV